MLRKMSFWLKIKAIIIVFGIGGEYFMYLEGFGPKWKALGIIITFMVLIITHIFQDANNNDIVDLFERKQKEQAEPEPQKIDETKTE